nr:ras-GEF domain-containing family member 1B-like isoform X1 [Onthophagus taurus]
MEKEKPKILGPKPSIANKPKHVPPVPLSNERLNKENVTRTGSFRNREQIEQHKRIGSNETAVPYNSKTTRGDELAVRKPSNLHVQNSQDKHGIPKPKLPTPISDTHFGEQHRCEKISDNQSTTTTFEWHKPSSDHKQPTSPSTVCCSILSSAANDCCGIILNTGKELHGKTLTHVESSDSNSSDSGGFKDFVQPEMSNMTKSHQRKVSQPDYTDCPKTFTHQRNASQPENISKPRPKPSINNAQALAQYLPQTAQHFITKSSIDRNEDFAQTIAKFNQQFHAAAAINNKTEDFKQNPRPISKTQFQQSTKKLEQLLSQGPDKEKLMKYAGIAVSDGDTRVDIEQKMKLQKQLQHKLHTDLQQTVKQIQEIRSIEIRLPQNQELTESTRTPSGIVLQQKSWNLPQGSHTKHSYSNGDVHKSMTKDQQQNGLVHRDDNLVSGSLDSLILHMVPTNVYYPDKAYIFAFLLSSRLYIKPHDLLDRIRSISESQQNARSSAGSENHGCTKFAENLVKLLEEWTQTFPYDFRDERVMQYVRTFTQYCCTLNSSLRANVSNLLHNLLQKLTALEAYDKSVETPMVSIEGLPGDITELCPNPGVLAQQLTHIELERLSFIGPEEFVQAFAKENLFLENAFRDMKKTRNLEHYVQWFNRLSYFVATQVCKCPKKKQRVKVVEYWVEVGGECLNIGNFNSLMGIIAGLNMSPIARLKKTWSKIQSGKFAILEHQMDPSNNFSSYRSTLKAAMWRSEGATDQQQKIVIPFFSLLVKDLYFLNQGCSNKLPNGHINFEKFWQLAKQVTEFMVWKQIECPFEKDPKVLSMLLHGPVHNENALALASFECEPPDNSQDKERCKSLKVDGITN